MKRIVLLTANYLKDYIGADHILHDRLNKMGYETTFKPWDGFKDDGEDLFVIRSTWNYTENLEPFLAFCESIADRLVNPFPVVKWNSDKRYLLDLEQRGLPVLPMKIAATAEEAEQAVAELAAKDGAEQFVAKPLVSASAKGLVTFAKDDIPTISQPMIIQKCHEEIRQGEVSLMYFDGKYSFAVLKTPKEGEIRVQSGFGGTKALYEPSAEIRQLGDDAISMIPMPTAYTRVDIVPGVGVIELECIEPGLYFHLHEEAASQCAEALIARL